MCLNSHDTAILGILGILTMKGHQRSNARMPYKYILCILLKLN